MGKTRL